MGLLTIQNPIVLELEPIRDLFDRAFAKENHADADETRKWLAEVLPSDQFGVFAWGDFVSGFTGLGIVGEGYGPISFPVMVLHIFARNDKQARVGIQQAIHDWVRQRDCKVFYSLNQSGHSDEQFIHLLDKFGHGVTSRVLCSVLEHRLE